MVKKLNKGKLSKEREGKPTANKGMVRIIAVMCQKKTYNREVQSSELDNNDWRCEFVSDERQSWVNNQQDLLPAWLE